MSAPVVLLLEPETRVRLRVVSALRGRVELQVPEDPSEPVVRVFRRVRPTVVLLALGRGRLAPGLQTCRQLATDQGGSARIGLTDRWCRLRHPAQALRGCHGHGYLGGVPTEPGIQAFVDSLLAQAEPVHLFPPEPGLLGRWIRRDRR